MTFSKYRDKLLVRNCWDETTDTKGEYMRRKIAGVLALFAVLALAGCYRATVNTGVQPGQARTESKWAHSWLYGLVPTSTVNATEVCGGQPAAVVETEHSFAQGVVAALTFGIYTPITISVTCGTR